MDPKQLFKSLLIKHPEQEARETLYEFLRDSYTGLGGYSQPLKIKDRTLFGRSALQSFTLVNVPESCYLDRFEMETADSFVNRLVSSTYVNYVQPIVDLYNDLLFRRQAVRTSQNSELSAWMGEGKIERITRRAMKIAQIHGSAFVILDSANVQASNLQEAIAQGYRGLEYAVLEPSRVLGWDADEQGNFRWIKYLTSRVVTDEPLAAPRQESIVTVWTADSWSRFVLDDKRQEAAQLDGGPNVFGVVPVAMLRFAASENGDFLGDSQSFPIATINRQMYNRLSELTLLLRGQAFSLLVFPKSLSDPSNEIQVGVGNVLYVDPESRVSPAFLSPSPTNSEIYEKRLLELQNDIFRAAKLEYIKTLQTGRLQGNVSSGLSRQFSFAQCNAALAAMGKQCERFESELMNIVAAFYRTTSDYVVEFPDNYEIGAGIAELDILQEAIAVGIPQSVLNKLRKNISTSLLNLNDGEMSTLDTELATSTTPSVE